MNDISIRPSKKLRALVKLYNSPNAACEAWAVPYSTFTAWLDNKGSLPGNLVATLVERTKLPYEALFEHAEAAK